MSTADVLVLVLVILVVAYEFYALGTPKQGDEITGYVRRLRDSGALGNLIVGGGSAWLLWHFVLDISAGMGWPDLAAIVAGYFLVKWRGPFGRSTKRGLPK